MLDIALQFLISELNTYALARTGSDTPLVKASAVVDDAGKYSIDKETIAATIVNIEEERVVKSHLPDHVYVQGRQVMREPVLRLNLYLLFSANFTIYAEALKHISLVLTFFQSHPAFSPDSSPGLDARIEKLIVELQSLSFEQLNQIWAFVGAKQLPSIVYRVRMVAIQDEAQTGVALPITLINTRVGNR